MRSGKSATLAVAVLLLLPGGPWFGTDKVKHFFLSAFVQSAGYSLARAAGAQRSASHIAGAVGSATAGIGREVHDRRAGKPFSVSDLAWDAAGAASMAVLLNRAR